jgi:hypothetical protein
MCILEGTLEDVVSDSISMVFLSSQHRTTKYGAWHCSLITDWPPSSSSQVDPAEFPSLHTVTSKQNRRHIFHSATDIITKSNVKRNPAPTLPNPRQEHTAQIIVRDCSARFSVGTDFSLQRLLAKTKSELGLSSHHCSPLLGTFTDWRNDSLLLRLRSFSTKQ